MKIKLLLILLMLFLFAGCSTKIYRQAGSDSFLIPYASEKAVVVIDTVAEHVMNGVFFSGETTKGPMLVGFAQMKPGRNQFQLYEAPEWEFATYPGSVIPGYAGSKPHGLHAYLLDPGVYAVIRCVYEIAEIDFCPEGYWTSNDKPVGIAYFEVSAGDVINTGQLQVTRAKGIKGSTYTVSINNNQSDAKKYIERNWPSLANRLQYKPLRFTY